MHAVVEEASANVGKEEAPLGKAVDPRAVNRDDPKYKEAAEFFGGDFLIWTEETIRDLLRR